MAIFLLALKSVRNRKFTAVLTILAIGLSVTLLLGVEKVRTGARQGFANTISGTDLIVGARSGAIQLLLYSVFRIGNATNNISWESYQDIAADPNVDWAVPISLGDSHRGFRVMGTTSEYFEHYRYARNRRLQFTQGRAFSDVFDTVLGAEVAAALGYQIGDAIVIAHGMGDVSFVEHDDKPFHVVGILNKTGTPVDRTVHVSLEGIEAMHIDWQGGAPIPGLRISAEQARRLDLSPKVITAFLLGLESKISAFKVQRTVNEYKEEPLLAILPGVALQEMWDLMGIAERALVIISACVVLTGLIGMVTVILTGLNERRREMAIFRSVGARPLHIFGLLMSEAGVFALLGVLLGVCLLYMGLFIAQPVIERSFGLFLTIDPPGTYELVVLSSIVAAGFLVGVIPAQRAYRYSLADGMTIRI